MSMSRCFRKTTCIYKVCLLRFQTFLSGCLTSLSRKEPLYCNLFKTAVLLSLTDHFIYLKTTLHGKNKKLISFQMPQGRILLISVRANLCLSCTDKMQHFVLCRTYRQSMKLSPGLKMQQYLCDFLTQGLRETFFF